VRFAASFHGSWLAPEGEDGAHRRFDRATGRIYVAAAGMDPTYDAAEHGRLAEALRAADVDHMIENYKGMGHGWTMADLPVFDADGYRRHMRRLKENLDEFSG
jgi:carboxymethylenebutenolidase